MRRPSMILAVLILATSVIGCTITSTIKLYDGPSKDESQIALLYVDPHVVVTRIDSTTEHPTDKGRALAHSAGKRREIVAINPGPHELTARFFVLCLQSNENIPLKFNAEPGKKYRLKSEVDLNNRRWLPSIVAHDGSIVEDTFPWMQAMCPANVQIMRLGK